MTWELFYLGCFVIGLVLSAICLLGGFGHLNLGGGHAVHVGVGHVAHGGHIGHVGAHGAHAAGHAAPGKAGSVPWWNSFTLMAFLCWFGGVGYLLTRYGRFVVSVVLLLSIVSGIIGGTLIFYFLARVLLPRERELTAEETAMPGVVAHVSSAIRSGGVGEILFTQLGARRSAPARSEDGNAIERGEEVFVLRYEGGIAYVRRWEDALPSAGSSTGAQQ